MWETTWIVAITLAVLATVILLAWRSKRTKNEYKDESLEYLGDLKYKFLKKAELPDVPDNELENAVMIWMSHKFDKDRPDDFWASFPKPCQNWLSCRTVSDNVHMSGLYLLFFNSYEQEAEMSIEGFRALGLPKLSAVMAKAVELYRQNKHILDGYADGTVDSFEVFHQAGIFPDELDQEFFAEDISDYVKYIRQNADCFGD